MKHQRPYPLVSLVIFSLVLMLTGCEKKGTLINPPIEFPQNYGTYLLTKEGWARLKNEPGKNALFSWSDALPIAATMPPQLLLFSQKIALVPHDFKKDAKWSEMDAVREQIVTIKNREGKMSDSYSRKIVQSWMRIGTNVREGMESKPVVGHADKIIVMPEVAAANARIVVSIDDELYSFDVGDSKKIPKKDEWIEAVDQRGTWNGWEAMTQGNAIMLDGLTLIKRELLPIEKLDDWSEFVKKQYFSTARTNFKVLSACAVQARQMGSTCTEELFSDLRGKIKNELTNFGSNSPSVCVQILEEIPSEIFDQELTTSKNLFSNSKKKIEWDIWRAFTQSLTDSGEKDGSYRQFELYSRPGMFSEKNKFKLGQNIVGIIQDGSDKFITAWYLRDLTKIEVGEKQVLELGIVSSQRATIYPVKLSFVKITDVTLEFSTDELRRIFVQNILDTRKQLEEKCRSGFVTEVIAPSNYYSEWVHIGASPWVARTALESHSDAAYVTQDKNGKDYDANAAVPLQTDIEYKVRFRSSGKEPVKVLVSRYPFFETEQLNSYLHTKH